MQQGPRDELNSFARVLFWVLLWTKMDVAQRWMNVQIHPTNAIRVLVGISTPSSFHQSTPATQTNQHPNECAPHASFLPMVRFLLFLFLLDIQVRRSNGQENRPRAWWMMLLPVPEASFNRQRRRTLLKGYDTHLSNIQKTHAMFRK